MSEVLWTFCIKDAMQIVEHHDSLNAKQYNLEVPGLRPAWAYEYNDTHDRVLF